MEAVYTWIRNLAGYFLFVTVLEQLLPGKKYGKYIRMFAGMVLILLVLQPFLNTAWLEGEIARAYESIVFRYEAEELSQDLLGIESQRLSEVISRYELAVAEDVSQIAEDAGYETENCQVKISRDQDSENFGTVTAVSVKVRKKGWEADEDKSQVQEKQTIPSVVPVVVELEKTLPGTERTQSAAASKGEDGQRENPAAERLRRKIASYYHLEEAYVEIQISEGKR